LALMWRSCGGCTAKVNASIQVYAVFIVVCARNLGECVIFALVRAYKIGPY
jgi:hypothetical protein